MGREPVELGGIESALEDIGTALTCFANHASNGDNKLQLFTGPEGSGYYPVLIALDPCSETTENLIAIGERIATAFERIADAMTAKKE